MGRALAALELKLDVMISSPLKRALQTAEIVASELGHKDKIVTDTALRPEASYQDFEALLARYGKKKAIMVVGHNPSMTDFLTRMLSGRVGRVHRLQERRGGEGRAGGPPARDVEVVPDA